MYQKLALLPKNDTAYVSEFVENLQNKGQTGGARDHTKEKGVARFPALMYPEEGSALFLGPKPVKVILIRKILDRKKGPEDFLKTLQNKLGQGAQIDYKLKKIVSKKYPTAEVYASFLTVSENLIPELEKLAKENKIPLLILKRKKQAKLAASSFEGKLEGKISEIEEELETLTTRIQHRYNILGQIEIIDSIQKILNKMRTILKRFNKNIN